MATRQQIQVDLMFNVNNSQAINNINQLNKLLTDISHNTTIGIDDGSLQQAVQSAKDLQMHLSKAVDVNTGRIDLNTLNTSLQSSNTSLKSLLANLQNAGPIGQQAFIKVANAISQAQAPLFRLNGALKNFSTTLLNTAKWQIASTAIHAVSGAMSSAINHAEELNRALNDIQIVTGYNDTTIANFAKTARQAATDLNTTVTDYAKASLIFYQQGLNAQESAERANTVIKLAQVTGQSAQMVSDQMTSIWNNFSDGKVELEYYADVLTKLGAATAASTDEISDGLQKFSAVARVVGLEYETAAAAVATVVDKTRQSADVVGTSFKTIFARLENLKLGETLDDGVDLTKYTQALESVGINVLTVDGQLRDMESILDELGSKWSNFSRTTQIALAQTVGGIRQYNQMIALMDNWSDVEKNIELAKASGGELQNQADIWSKSFEGARARVKNASNQLFESFIDDEAIVKITDSIAHIIDGAGDVINAIGGIGPLILGLGGLFSKFLLPIGMSVFSKLGNFIHVQTGGALRDTIELQRQMAVEMQNTMTKTDMSSTEGKMLSLSQELLNVKMQLNMASKNASAAENEEMQARLNNYEALNLEIQKTLEHKLALEAELKATKDKLNNNVLLKQNMAEYGAIGEFRTNHQTDDNIDVDSIVDQATNTSSATTKKEIANIEQIISKNRELRDLKQQIQTIEAQQDTEGVINDETNELTQLQEIYQQKVKEYNLDERSEEELQGELSQLKEVLALQEKITQARRQNVENISVGSMNVNEVLNNSSLSDSFSTDDLMSQEMITSDIGMDINTGTIDVSIGSFEKLITTIQTTKTALGEMKAVYSDLDMPIQEVASALQAQSNASAKVDALEKQGKKNTQEYKKAVEERTKAEEKLKAVQDKVAKSSEKTTKNLLKAKNQIFDFAKTTKMSAKDMDILKESFDKLEKGSATSKDFDIIAQSLNNMKTAAGKADIGLDMIAQDMMLMLTDAGMSQEALQQIISNLEKTGAISADVANKMRQLTGEFTKLSQAPALTSSLATIGQNLMSLAGSAQMAFSGFSMLFSAFDEGASSSERIISFLSGLTMILPIAGKLFSGVADSIQYFKIQQSEATTAVKEHTTAENLDTAATIAGTGADAAGIVVGEGVVVSEGKEVIAKKANTKATLANTVAQVANWVAKNPVVGAAVAAAVIGITIAMVAYTSSIEKNTEAIEKENEAKMQNAQASREEIETNKELLNSYNDLLTKYKETGEGKEQLDEAAQKLAEAYDLEGAALAKLTGNYADYKKVSDAAYQAHQRELKEQLGKEEDALRGASEKLLQTAREADLDANGSKLSGTDYLLTLDGYGSDDARAASYLKRKISSEFLQGGTGGTDSTDVHFELGNITKDPSKLIALYDELNTVYKEMSESSTMARSGVYSDLRQYLNTIRDDVEAAKDYLTEVERLSMLLGESKAFKGMSDELYKVENVEQYITWTDKLTKAMQKEGKTQTEINDAIEEFTNASSNSRVKQLKTQYEGLQDISKSFNIDINNAINYFNDLSDEQKTLYFSIDFDNYKTEQAWDEQIQLLQAKVDGEKLEAQIEIISGVESSLKSDLSVEDIAALETSGITWGQDGVIAFSSFLKMSYEQQGQYLHDLKQQYIQADREVVAYQLNVQTKYVQELREQLKKATSADEINKIKSMLEATNAEVERLSVSLSKLDTNEFSFKETAELFDSLSGIQYGDIIADEMYLKLSKYFPELAASFVSTLEGYQLWESALDFEQKMKSALNDTALQTYDKAIAFRTQLLNERNLYATAQAYTGSLENAYDAKTQTWNQDIFEAQWLAANGYSVKPEGVNIPNYALSEEQREAMYRANYQSLLQNNSTYNDAARDQLFLTHHYTNTDLQALSSSYDEESKIRSYTPWSQEFDFLSEDNISNLIHGAEIDNNVRYRQKRTSKIDYESINRDKYYTGYDINSNFSGQTKTVRADQYLSPAKKEDEDYNVENLSAVTGIIYESEIKQAWQNNAILLKQAMQEADEQTKQDIINYYNTTAKSASDAMLSIIEADQQEWYKIDEQVQEQNRVVLQAMTTALQNAKNFEERQKILKQNLWTEDEIVRLDIGIGEDGKYLDVNDLTEEQALNRELQSQYMKNVIETINQEAEEGIDLAEWQEYSDYLQSSLDLTEEGAEELSRTILKMNRGVETLHQNWSDWEDVLRHSSDSSEEYVKAAKGLQKSLSDILDVSEDFIDIDFMTQEENLQLIGKAAEGDAEVIDALALALANDIALDAINNLEISDIFTKEEKNSAIDNVSSLINEISQLLSTELPQLELGQVITLSDTEQGALLAKMQEVVTASKMTVEEANAYYRTLGFVPKFKETSLRSANSISLTTTHHSRDVSEWHGDTPIKWTDTEWAETTTVPGSEFETKFPAISAETLDGVTVPVPTAEIESVTYTGGGTLNNRSVLNAGGNKSSSGGSQSKSKAPKKSDTVERYKEITDKLDDNTDAMDKASKAADRLYGPARIRAMQTVNELLRDEIDLLKDKKDEANLYLPQDKKELEEALAEATTFSNNKAFQFDENGNISNYTDVMSSLWDEYNAFYEKVTANDQTPSDADQEKLDKMQAELDLIKERKDAYEETRELIEDIDQSILDKFDEWQSNNYEMLNAKIDLKLEISDAELERLDYQLSKIEDDFYSMAEAANIIGADQFNVYKDNLEAIGTKYKDLQTSYLSSQENLTIDDILDDNIEKSLISQADYVEGLKDVTSGIYDNLNSLRELDSTMMDYYSNTLVAAGEELAKYTDLMENSAGVLEHYASIAELLGKSTDYKYMGKILEGQANVAKNAYAISKANYDMLAKQTADRKSEYEAAVKAGARAEELELLKKNWDEAQKSVAEAQDIMLSDAEAWAEAVRAVFDNQLADLGQDLEKTLAGGFGSFDEMNKAFERKNSLQEEYLTTTNKIYETNKMMRAAQQEIDKTTNAAAKMRLKQFINETSALQDQTQLSQYELDIQQAKYDLLLAEIALEEAQNAKSTVRLQRDNEGNLSYVYTANQDKVADAQQKFEDAQNNLYNIGLEGANDYVQKQQEIMQEMADTLAEIEQNNADKLYATEEEYNQARDSARAYYFAKLEQYSHLYQIALTTDANVVKDAWTTEFATMTTETEKWKVAVDTYLAGTSSAFTAWEEQVNIIATQTTGKDLETLAGEVKKITDESDALAKEVVDDIIPQLDEQLTKVANVTTTYAGLRWELNETAKAYEEIALQAEEALKTIGEVQSAMGNEITPFNPSGGTGASGNNGGTNETNNSATGNNGSGASVVTGTYTVKSGDTLSGIAAAHGMSWQELYNKNKDVIGSNPNLIYGGQVLKFDTGGYTGDWAGSYGKFALLHKKELILEPNDTANFLASMEVLERILQMIDLQATSAQLGGLLTMPTLQHNNKQTIDQNVRIEAHFPGITDHNELEMAFDSLINQASQYANRK